MKVAFVQNKFHYFPNIAVCPAVPDVLDFDSLEKGKNHDYVTIILAREDMTRRSGSLSNETRRDLMVFAMAGAGFRYFESYVKRWRRCRIEGLTKLFHTWRGNRSVTEFYQFMYEDNGVRCENVCVSHVETWVRQWIS